MEFSNRQVKVTPAGFGVVKVYIPIDPGLGLVVSCRSIDGSITEVERQRDIIATRNFQVERSLVEGNTCRIDSSHGTSRRGSPGSGD